MAFLVPGQWNVRGARGWGCEDWMGRHISGNQPSSGTGTFLLEPAPLGCRAPNNSPSCRNKSTDIWMTEASPEPFNAPSPLYRTRWLMASRQQSPGKSAPTALSRRCLWLHFMCSSSSNYSWDPTQCLRVTSFSLPAALDPIWGAGLQNERSKWCGPATSTRDSVIQLSAKFSHWFV